MPATSKAQQKFMGMVHGLQKGTVKSSDVSNKVKKAADSMSDKEAEDYASIKHKGLPKKAKSESTKSWNKSLEKIAKDRQLKSLSKKDRNTLLKIAKMMKKANESTLNENPAASAAAAMVMMQMQNPDTGKKIKAITPLKNKDHKLHNKAKGIFKRLKDKFSKKKSQGTVHNYLKGEEVEEGFGGDLKGSDKQKFEKARKENAEQLGYELTGVTDIKEGGPGSGPKPENGSSKDKPKKDAAKSKAKEKDLEDDAMKQAFKDMEGEFDFDETVDEDRDYKAEYKKFQSSTKSKKYRAELNQYNRKKGTYGNGDGKDASHKGGKIVGFEAESKNRGRAEKSRLKKESTANFRRRATQSIGGEELMKFLMKRFKMSKSKAIASMKKHKMDMSFLKKESVNEKMGPKELHAYMQHVFDTQFKTADDKKMKKILIKKLNNIQKKKGRPLFKESVNEDIGIDVYLGGIVKSMRKAGLKPKTAKQMKRGFSKSRDKVGFFIDVEQRGFDRKEKYTLQLEVDKKGDLWYLSAPKDIKLGKWADTNKIARGFKALNKIRGFGQTKLGKK